MLGRIGFATVAMLGLAVPASAQDADIAAGKAYAEQVCAQCHAVQAGEDLSPAEGATPFQEVANTPGMTEYALSVWLQSSHPTMPNIVLEQDEMRNVIAYIRSLDSRL
ncbi:c-type cytochrome [Methyloceanibacter sp.]|uniref:c-type cytochrome n=1 Tax=Methyloceanibacter sp. TaxID=1965321 RepID=UPI002CB07C25|nr:c-type cytochrome [Methyloceanibacter sp.]HML93185.1 c-type cytochrome [Methyloceanibacter sp.]